MFWSGILEGDQNCGVVAVARRKSLLVQVLEARAKARAARERELLREQ
jgi:hypothetical protein